MVKHDNTDNYGTISKPFQLIAKQNVFHRIKTGSKTPTFPKPQYLSTQKFNKAKQEFRNLRKAGVISYSKLKWSSAVHMVPKSICIYRTIGDSVVNTGASISIIPKKYLDGVVIYLPNISIA